MYVKLNQPLKPGAYIMYHQCLTFNNSRFCTNSVFVCFLWISEQEAATFLLNF